jgi:hypothetical protein
MAGVGIHFYPGVWHQELEEEWLEQCPHPRWKGDARNMWQLESCSIGTIVTSQSFGNRMSDHHNARDISIRNTYKHRLGRDLTEGNTGAMPWKGKEYRPTHIQIWKECHRILVPGGPLIWNCKNHYIKTIPQYVTEWHLGIMLGLGFTCKAHWIVPAVGNQQGANREQRFDHEHLFWMIKEMKPTNE